MLKVLRTFKDAEGKEYELAVTWDDLGVRLTGPELDYTMKPHEATALRQLLQLIENVNDEE